MSCLVIKNDGIGDLVLCSGILSELSKRFNGELDLVTCETNQEIAEIISGIRKTYYVSRDNLCFPKNGVHKPPIGEKDKVTLLKIAMQKYDIVICLRRFIRQSSLILMNCISAKEKYCCWQIPTNASWEEAETFSKNWNHYSGDIYTFSELEYFGEFCSTILNTPIYALPNLQWENASDHVAYNDETVGLGISGEAVELGAMWAELAKLLINEGWTVHLFGETKQSPLADFITQLAPSVINHTGKLTITESLQYLKCFNYYIGADTGLSHLASLAVPNILVVLGGGTFPRFFPWPDKLGQHVIFYGLSCYDCDWQCKYPSRYCLELVSATIVLKYFLKIAKGEQIPRMINIGNPYIKYQISWTRSREKQEKISFDELQTKL